MSGPVNLHELLALSTEEHCVARPDARRAVYASDHLRWLCSPPGAVQSAIDLRDPRYPVLPNHIAMSMAAALPPRVARVLDLGAGCGALLRFARGLPDTTEVAGVEKDPVMLDIARSYFDLPASLPVVIASALDFLQQSRGGWDLVFCDLFDGLREPEWLLSGLFCTALNAALSPDGVAALNLLPDSEARLKAQLETALGCFGGVGLLRVETQDNLVLLLQHSSMDKGQWAQRLCREPHFAFAGHARSWLDTVRILK